MQIESFVKNYSQGRQILKDAIPLALPLCISLEASNLCNFKCIMCYHGSDRYAEESKPLQNMDASLFMKCVADIRKWCEKEEAKVKLIKLYSLGEPLLHPNICDMVRTIKEADICDMLEITSNASLLSKETAEKLVDNGLDIFRASIYSVDEEKNRQITQTNVSPKQIEANIRYMKEYRDSHGYDIPFISAKMIDSYSDENERFRAIYKEAADEAYLDKLMDSPANDNTVERYYADKVDEARRDIGGSRIYKERKACRYPFTHMTVRSDGKVLVCCTDWPQKTVVGNAVNESLEDVWHSKALYDFRCMMLKTKGCGNSLCVQCDIPLRDSVEDNIDDFPIERLSYRTGGIT